MLCILQDFPTDKAILRDCATLMPTINMTTITAQSTGVSRRSQKYLYGVVGSFVYS